MRSKSRTGKRRSRAWKLVQAEASSVIGCRKAGLRFLVNLLRHRNKSKDAMNVIGSIRSLGALQVSDRCFVVCRGFQ